jgi:hypothetical protein
MAVTEKECESMIDAASRANVKLMIAYRLHFEREIWMRLLLFTKRKSASLAFFIQNFVSKSHLETSG